MVYYLNIIFSFYFKILVGMTFAGLWRKLYRQLFAYWWLKKCQPIV